MYSSVNNIGIITGASGKYDQTINDSGVKWGRNAVCDLKETYLKNYTQPRVTMPDLKGLSKATTDEFTKTMDELDKSLAKLDENEQKRPPLQFKMQYLPNEVESKEKLTDSDKQALMGAAYEEMDKQQSINVEDLSKTLQETADGLLGQNSGVEMSASALDINKDGKIDIGEYASSILVSDALSNNGVVKGTINEVGLNKQSAYGNKKNYQIASEHYKAMYDLCNLSEAHKKFVSNPNNLI